MNRWTGRFDLTNEDIKALEIILKKHRSNQIENTNRVVEIVDEPTLKNYSEQVVIEEKAVCTECAELIEMLMPGERNYPTCTLCHHLKKHKINGKHRCFQKCSRFKGCPTKYKKGHENELKNIKNAKMKSKLPFCDSWEKVKKSKNMNFKIDQGMMVLDEFISETDEVFKTPKDKEKEEAIEMAKQLTASAARRIEKESEETVDVEDVDMDFDVLNQDDVYSGMEQEKKKNIELESEDNEKKQYNDVYIEEDKAMDQNKKRKLKDNQFTIQKKRQKYEVKLDKIKSKVDNNMYMVEKLFAENEYLQVKISALESLISSCNG